MKNYISCLLFIIIYFLSSCGKLYPVDLGQGFVLDCNDSFSSLEFIMYPDGIRIAVFEHVVEYRVSDRFIIATQKPWFEYLDSTNNLNVEGFKYYKFRQYWIIDKYKQKSYGPFTKEQYLEKKKELGVPDTLKLQFERHK